MRMQTMNVSRGTHLACAPQFLDPELMMSTHAALPVSLNASLYSTNLALRLSTSRTLGRFA